MALKVTFKINFETPCLKCDDWTIIWLLYDTSAQVAIFKKNQTKQFLDNNLNYNQSLD